LTKPPFGGFFIARIFSFTCCVLCYEMLNSYADNIKGEHYSMQGNCNIKRFAFALIVFLTACSPTQQTYRQNIQLYFDTNRDIELSNDAINNSSVDLILVKNGQRAKATMALAFIENGRYKWVSADNAVIISENGRIVRMVGFKQNLMHVSNLASDPIKTMVRTYTQEQSWNRYIDTELGDIGAELHSQLRSNDSVTLIIQGAEFSTIKIEEHVEYKSAVFGKHQWTNTFWFDRNSKQLLKSIQKVAPNMDSIDITYVSRALRLVKAQGIDDAS